MSGGVAPPPLVMEVGFQPTLCPLSLSTSTTTCHCHCGLSQSLKLCPAPWCVCSQDHQGTIMTCFSTAITCGHPGNPAHGVTNGSEFNLNDLVNFTCDTGYLLQGSSRAQCRSNGQWSSPLPTCRGRWPWKPAPARGAEELYGSRLWVRDGRFRLAQDPWLSQ